MTRVLITLLLNISISATAADYNSISVQGRLDPAVQIDNVKVYILDVGGDIVGTAVDGDIVGTATEVSLKPDTNGVFTVRLVISPPDVFQKNAVDNVSFKNSLGIEIAKLPIGSVPFALAIKGAGASGNIVGVTGNVGIGTTIPGQKLTVAGMIESTVGGVMFPDGSVQMTATPAPLWVKSGNNIYSGNSGNVGIGTNNPLGVFEVDVPSYKYVKNADYWGGHSTPRCPCDTSDTTYDCSPEFASTDLGPICYDWRTTAYWWQYAYNRVIQENSSAPVLIASKRGYVGIGKTDPSTALDVNGAVTATGMVGKVDIFIQSDSQNTGAGIIAIKTGNRDSVTVLNNGNVGVGTTSPGSKLSVVGGNLSVSNDANNSGGNVSVTGGNLSVASDGNYNGGDVNVSGDYRVNGVSLGMRFLGKYSANSVSQLTITGLNPWRYYKIYYAFIQQTSPGIIKVTLNGVTNGYSFAVSASNQASGVCNTGSSTGAYIPLSCNTPRAVNTLQKGDIDVLGYPYGGGDNRMYILQRSYSYSSAAGFEQSSGGGSLNLGSNAFSSVTIGTTVGTINGTAYLYQISETLQ